jgi:serine/threonine-protein kinase
VETFGRFVVHESLATSDVATLHRAELPDVNGMPMPLALRRLAPGAPEPAMRLFVDEAQLGMWLSHPNIARVYELGDIEGRLFAAMEYVPGKTVGELAGRAAPVPVALAIVRQVCEALAHVHGLRDPNGQFLGIVHGDLVAANVAVGESGIVKVGAFGRRGPGTRDARDDLFAVGVIAYELLTGRAPDLAANATPSSLEPRIPRDIDALVMTALARDPAHRWQYAAVMRDALVTVARAAGLEAGPEHIAAWLREPPPVAAPPAPAPAAAPAPRTTQPRVSPSPAPPPVWVDDDGATQISEAPLDDVLVAAEAAAAAEIAAMRARTPQPTPAAGAARTSSPAVRPEPVPLAPEPPPDPDEPSGPYVPGKPRLPTELEMPTEGTQIGAKPLESFGGAPLAPGGANAPRPSAPMMPSGVSLPDPAYARRRRRMWSMIIAAAALIVAATIVLLVI